MIFQGYVRPDGTVGSRNLVAVIPSVVCANDVAQAIVAQVQGTVGLYHHQGCCQLPPDLDRVTETVPIGEEDYVVVMTNGHSHDFAVQEQVLRGKYAYIGVIGSRAKTASVNARLREAGISEAAIASVHTPIGTAIKAVTPEEIAVSIAGEMICVRATRWENAGVVLHGCPMH